MSALRASSRVLTIALACITISTAVIPSGSWAAGERAATQEEAQSDSSDANAQLPFPDAAGSTEDSTRSPSIDPPADPPADPRANPRADDSQADTQGDPQTAPLKAPRTNSYANPGLEPTQEMRVPGFRPAANGETELDSLLQLPRGYQGRSHAESVAGASEKEWRRRFVAERAALSDARERLDATKRELDATALSGGGAQWNIAPPGGGGGGAGQSTSPLSFKLRQALKANRLELDAAERSMRELEIEANLAGVPKTWRGTPQRAADQPPREVGQLLD